MTKRSKSNTDGAVFTYHERRQMDHGSTRMRLPSISLKPWDSCALGLVPSNDPVITPHGVLYEREAILRDLLRQRKQARLEQQRVATKLIDQQVEKEIKKQSQQKSKLKQFEISQQLSLTQQDSKPTPTQAKTQSSRVESNFWLPSIRNKVKQSQQTTNHLEKSINKKVRTSCPITNKPLRAKQLIAIKPTLNKVTSTQNAPKYMCPLCKTALVNASKPIALITGTVMCSQCVTNFVIKHKTDPISSTAIDVDQDIIPIFNLGTAFAASAQNDPSSREAVLYRPSVR